VKLTQEDLDRFVAEQRSESYRELCFYVLKDFVGRELNEGEVRRYAKQRYRNPNSYNLALALFKSFAKWKRSKIPPVDREHMMQRFELEQIEGIRRERVVRRVEKKGLTLEELRRVLRRLPQDGLEFSIIWLLHYFGVRPGELCALRPNMVDFKRGAVRFVTEKTKVERQLYFDGFTAGHLRRFLDAKPCYMRVYQTCRRAGIRPKSGRQTFISLMQGSLAGAGYDPVRLDLLVKTLAGHTTGDITAVYTDIGSHIRSAMLEHHFMRPLEGELES